MKFLYPPSVDWDFMFQRPHQLMTSFANIGHTSYFVNTKPMSEIEEIKENLFLIPQTTYYEEMDFDVLFYSYPPIGITMLNITDPKFTIFDSVDEPTDGVFSFWNANNAYYESLERADLVLATADSLYERAKEYNDNVILCPNACDFSYFDTPQPQPSEILGFTKPIILYSGAIASWVDIDLIVKCAQAMPEYEFVCIGAEFNDTFPKKVPANLHFYGHKPYNQVAGFIQSATACIIPFKAGDPEVEACNPIKMWEYFACGKPVISTAMPETNRKGVYWSETEEIFMENIHRAVEKDCTAWKNYRKYIAKENSWDMRASQIVEEIKRLS